MKESKANRDDLVMRLNSIIETAIDGIITIDDRGRVESFNQAAAVLFGYHSDEVIGHNIKMLMPEPYHSEHDGYLHRYNTTREARIIGIGREVKGRKKDGSIFSFRLAVSEVVLNDRIIFTGIIHDLSQVKEAEEALRHTNASLESLVEARTQELDDAVNRLLKSNRELEESKKELNASLAKERELNQLKSRFVSMASHEFRTPLTTILSSASLISRYNKEEHDSKRQDHVNHIKSAVANLTGILNDFLSLSKLEEGMVDVHIEHINITTLCDEVSTELRGIFKKGQIIQKKVIGGEGQFLSDKRILKNILFNLISNAIKYSPEGSPIDCTFTMATDHVRINVEDRGIGIPKDEQQYLFDRFFRATNADNIQGTGLGLTIIKRYIDMLGGSITFKSTENVGSTFTITLPKKYEIYQPSKITEK